MNKQQENIEQLENEKTKDCVHQSRFYIHCGDDINKQLMDTESDFNIHIEEVCSDEDLIRLCNRLNKQDEKIKVLQNTCENMNKRLSEKSKCDYKKAIIEFCKFMNINNPLTEVMVDEFLQEVFDA